MDIGLDVSSGGPSSESVSGSVPDPKSDPVSSGGPSSESVSGSVPDPKSDPVSYDS